jgi:hypothetical protein
VLAGYEPVVAERLDALGELGDMVRLNMVGRAAERNRWHGHSRAPSLDRKNCSVAV